MEVKTRELNLRVGHIEGILRPDKYIKGVRLDKEEIKGLSLVTVKCYGPKKVKEYQTKKLRRRNGGLRRKSDCGVLEDE